jgi:tetratricopeptide (TPR) repeat protein
MVSFEVLNHSEEKEVAEKDNTDDEEIDKLIGRYMTMLECMQQDDRDQALQICQEILDSVYLKKNLDPLATDSKALDLQDSPIHTLKYSIYKNYGKLLNNENSLEYYQKVASINQASSIDPSDIKLRVLICELQQERGDFVSAHETIVDCLKYPLMKHEEIGLIIRLTKVYLIDKVAL